MFVHRLAGVSRNKPLHISILLMVLIALTLLALFLTSLRPTDVKMNTRHGSMPINLPLKEHSGLSHQETKEYDLTGRLVSSFLAQHVVNITADGCIKYFWINRIPVSKNNIVHGKNCDSTNGFDIDLEKYLNHSNNTFEIVLVDSGANDGGWLGLNIKNSYYDQLYRILIEILVLEIMLLLYFFLKNHLQLPTEIVITVVLGVLIRLLYLRYTPYNERSYDVLFYGGHLDYIQYVANHFQLPNPDMDMYSQWEYHQPPLYYVTAAIIYKISQNLALDYSILLQVLSLAYFTVFLIFGILILRRFCKSQWMFLTCTALFVFWPSGIIHSIRLGNDVMYYMVSVIGLYFLIQWIAEKQEKHFYLAALFIALTIATKLSGLIWLGMLGCFFLLHILKKQHSAAYLKQILFLVSVLGIALYFSLGRNALAALHDHRFNILNGTSAYTMDSKLAVKDNLNNFLYFDVNIYITKPFTSSWADADGRQYFWNYLLKTMLFGEFSFPSPSEQALATMFSLVLLQMIFFFFVGFILSIRNLSHLHLLFLLWLVFSLLSLISYRHGYPFSSNADFRYLVPTIIPFIYFYISGVNFFIQHKLGVIGKFRYILICSFITFLFLTGTCFFFIIPLLLFLWYYFFRKRKISTIGSFGYILAYMFIAGNCLFFILPLGTLGN